MVQSQARFGDRPLTRAPRQLRLPMRRKGISVFQEAPGGTTESAKLRWWRIHVLGWSTAALAAVLGYSERTVCHYELGRMNGRIISERSWQRFRQRCAQVAGKDPARFNWGVKP